MPVPVPFVAAADRDAKALARWRHGAWHCAHAQGVCAGEGACRIGNNSTGPR
ncbi:MAG: hypothetical protein WAV85_17025 [Rhodoferax sp.]